MPLTIQKSDGWCGSDSTGMRELKCLMLILKAKRIMHVSLNFHKVIILKLFLKMGNLLIGLNQMMTHCIMLDLEIQDKE